MSHLNILVTGSHGLVGTALVPALEAADHTVIRLVRSPLERGARQVRWEPMSDLIDSPALEGTDAVIHLAGENLATGRWSAARKASIRESRVRGTRLLCDALARLAHPPKVLLSASAIGYYGDRGEELLTEGSSAGRGFLAEVCQEWEAATANASGAGIRTVLLRFGMILSGTGGALARMLWPFRLGLGGRLGSGSQYWSWIAIDDALAAISHALARDQLTGPLNLVSPQPVTNKDFTRTLGRVLGRPAVLPAPVVALRMAFGDMADEALLASTRAAPARLLESGFRFRRPELRLALASMLD